MAIFVIENHNNLWYIHLIRNFDWITPLINVVLIISICSFFRKFFLSFLYLFIIYSIIIIFIVVTLFINLIKVNDINYLEINVLLNLYMLTIYIFPSLNNFKVNSRDSLVFIIVFAFIPKPEVKIFFYIQFSLIFTIISKNIFYFYNYLL